MVSNCFFLNISTPTWGNDPTWTKSISKWVGFSPPKNSVFRFSTYGNSSEKFRKETPSGSSSGFATENREKKHSPIHKSPGQMCPPTWDDQLRAFSSKNGWEVWRGGELFQHPIGSRWKFGFWKDGSGSFRILISDFSDWCWMIWSKIMEMIIISRWYISFLTAFHVSMCFSISRQSHFYFQMFSHLIVITQDQDPYFVCSSKGSLWRFTFHWFPLLMKIS